MNSFEYRYIDLSTSEKKIIHANNHGLDVFFRALCFEEDLINGFISDIDSHKMVSRKTTRVKINSEISSSISRLRRYLFDNFAFNPTTQEIYWLVCQYLFSKYPGFRAFN